MLYRSTSIVELRVCSCVLYTYNIIVHLHYCFVHVYFMYEKRFGAAAAAAVLRYAI